MKIYKYFLECLTKKWFSKLDLSRLLVAHGLHKTVLEKYIFTVIIMMIMMMMIIIIVIIIIRVLGKINISTEVHYGN